MRKIRTVAVLPTMFTLGNLICGFFSLVVASRVEKPVTAEVPVASKIAFSDPTHGLGIDPTDPTHNIMLSGWLIFLAMVFDALDGHVARLSRTSSEFGAQLDSLCDVVTFGVAPGFLLVKMVPQFTHFHPGAIWIMAAAFPACAALRLARFNVETSDDDDHLHFSGLPSPAAGGSIAGFAILFYTLRSTAREEGSTWLTDIDVAVQHMLPFFAVMVAALMVSRIPYPHIVNQVFRGHRSFAHIVYLFFALIAVMMVKGYAVPILAVVFVLGPPIAYLIRRVRQRSVEAEPLF